MPGGLIELPVRPLGVVVLGARVTESGPKLLEPLEIVILLSAEDVGADGLCAAPLLEVYDVCVLVGDSLLARSRSTCIASHASSAASQVSQS